MKTVKQVSELTGISIRTLQYYDEIGLFKPSKVSKAGYRLYSDSDLQKLQQILFFKELDFPLKEIKKIMEQPDYSNMKAYQKQKEYISAKRDRYNDLLILLDRLLKGEKVMSFKEFDMSEYFNALQDFKENHSDEVVKHWGSMEEFNKMLDNFKDKEQEIAKNAIMQFGSIEKYTEAMKKNLNNFTETVERINSKKDKLNEYTDKNNELIRKITSDLTKDIESEEIQSLVKEYINLVNENMEGINMGEHFWDLVIEGHLKDSALIEATDKIYGTGTANYLGRALQKYFNKQS